jgi:hypothetical protein
MIPLIFLFVVAFDGLALGSGKANPKYAPGEVDSCEFAGMYPAF